VPRYASLERSPVRYYGAGLRAKNTPDVDKLVGKERKLLQDMREATRCTRCDWDVAFDRLDEDARLGSLEQACELLLLDARSRFTDTREAADRALEVLRAATDVDAGSLRAYKISAPILFKRGYECLAETIARAEPGALDLDAISKDLARIKADRTSLADLVRGERLSLRNLTELDDNSLVTGKAGTRLAIIDADRRVREAESVAAGGDRAACLQGLSDLGEKAYEAGNERAASAISDLEFDVKRSLEVDSMGSLLGLEIQLEKEHAAKGAYPASIEIPKNPTGDGLIAYEPSKDGKGFRLTLPLERHQVFLVERK